MQLVITWFLNMIKHMVKSWFAFKNAPLNVNFSMFKNYSFSNAFLNMILSMILFKKHFWPAKLEGQMDSYEYKLVVHVFSHIKLKL